MVEPGASVVTLVIPLRDGSIAAAMSMLCEQPDPRRHHRRGIDATAVECADVRVIAPSVDGSVAGVGLVMVRQCLSERLDLLAQLVDGFRRHS